MNNKKILIFMLGILLVGTVFGLVVEQQVSVHVLAKPEINLFDKLDGDPLYDFDGTVYAQLNADPLSRACFIKWKSSWKEIDVSQTFDTYIFYTDGVKTVKYKCLDDYGNSMITDDSIEVLIGGAPEISIVSPLPKFYPVNEIPIIVNANTLVKKIMYSDNGRGFRKLCQYCDHGEELKVFYEGHHNFVVKIIDNFGRVFTKDLEFDVDGHAPRIRSIEPKNSKYSKGEFKIKYSELLLESVTLFWREIGETEYNSVIKLDCPSGENQECVFNVDFGQVQNIEIEFYFEIMNKLNSDRSQVNKIYIDTSNPIITMHSPIKELFENKKVLFDIELNEKVAKLEYSDNNGNFKRLCRDCEKYQRNKGFKEGKHDIIIKAIDRAGNKAEEFFSFFIDSNKPKITILNPKRGFTNGDFEVQFKEENPVEFILNYGKEGSWENKNIDLETCYDYRRDRKKCDIEIDLTSYDGQEIEYWFEMKDIAENKDESKKIKIDIDTTAPVLNDEEFWNQGIGRYNRYIYFSFDITEENFDRINYIDYESEKPKPRRLCSRLKDGVCKRKKSFTKGKHNLTIQILDKAGNMVEIKDIIFEVV